MENFEKIIDLLFSKQKCFSDNRAWGVMKEQQEKIKIRNKTMRALLIIIEIWWIVIIFLTICNRLDYRGCLMLIGPTIILFIWCFISDMKVVTLSREGCAVSFLLWKKIYKWEELGIIQEDEWYADNGDSHYHGIIFSKNTEDKKKRKYTTRRIVYAPPFSDRFFVISDEHGNVVSYKLQIEKGKKPKLRKDYINIREKLNEWGVEVEKGEGIKREEKQRLYDEMAEIRRQQSKERSESKWPDGIDSEELSLERIKIKDSWLITIVALITVILMWIGLSAEEGEKIPMLVFFALFDIPLMLWALKSVTLSKDGCKISYLFWKREYKWEELEIVREDRFHSYRDTNSRGIVFSKRKKNKAGYTYKTREIVNTGHPLEHFYIILDIDGNVSYKRLVKKDGKRVIRKLYVNVPEKLNEWGVELERGDNMFPSL